jgi:hypothetical protein
MIKKKHYEGGRWWERKLQRSLKKKEQMNYIK